MKTPSQTADYLKQREDKEATKALKEREKHLRRVGRELSDILDRAITKGEVTEKGGHIEYPRFGCMDTEEGVKYIQEIFRRDGWNCEYHPHSTEYYSRTCKGSSVATNHYFYLAPLKNEEEGDKLTKELDKQFKDKRVRPLSNEERKEVEARIEKRVRPYKMKRRPSLDDFTPM